MSKTTDKPYPYGEIFIEKVAVAVTDTKPVFGWRLSPVLAPLAAGGGNAIFGNPFVAHGPAQAYREAVNKARNVVKDGNVERVALRGRGADGALVDLAVVVAARIAKLIRNPEGCFLGNIVGGEK